VPSISTTVMSLASDTRLRRPMSRLGQRRELRFSKAEIRAKRHASYARTCIGVSLLFAGENAERFQLAVQVRALETASFGNARNRAVHLCKMMLEVGSLEGLAGLAQGRSSDRSVSAARRANCGSTRSASATPISSSKLVKRQSYALLRRDPRGYPASEIAQYVEGPVEKFRAGQKRVSPTGQA